MPLSAQVDAKQARKMWEKFSPVFEKWIPTPCVLHLIPTPAFTPPILHKTPMRIVGVSFFGLLIPPSYWRSLGPGPH